MTTAQRSGCPIDLTLQMLGDRWSLIVIRDVMFGNRRRFRELLTRSEEGIASNMLADRLKRLVESGLLTRVEEPGYKQRAIYSLTETAIQLVPLLAEMSAWGRRHTPVSTALSIRAQLLAEGGSALWTRMMDELRAIHLGLAFNGPSVMAELQAAFEAVAKTTSATFPGRP